MAEKMIETDVLVVGGGGAGFRAAIGAREAGVKALLLSKGPLARCGATPMAGADFTLDGYNLSQLGFPGEPRDTPEKFFNRKNDANAFGYRRPSLIKSTQRMARSKRRKTEVG